MSATLRVTSTGQAFTLEGETSIGRSVTNAVVISDSSVSRSHARILRQGSQWFIEDCGSANGTSVNGVRLVKRRGLQNGDQIKFGEVSVVFNPLAVQAANVLRKAAGAMVAAAEAAIKSPAPPASQMQSKLPKKKTRWDIFISFASEDKKHADQVHRYLTNEKRRVFFSPKTLNRAQFAHQIQEALDQCQHLVVVTSKGTHAEKHWVKEEWLTFLNECNAGRKKGSLLTVWCGKSDAISDLPLFLRSKEVIPLSDLARIKRYLNPVGG